ncbi:hypothetical protein [Yanshouia hominis]|uniref:Uncharacterized protein n=1 Tax=Yanshouia hominis TaxID=2763673 RepID=A0ABR7NJ32_9FIRM|nr:hypothetical protein [Yanshouia hominis]MBC8576421.1 hypothetical protein [Yanshouia hominis]
MRKKEKNHILSFELTKASGIPWLRSAPPDLLLRKGREERLKSRAGTAILETKASGRKHCGNPFSSKAMLPYPPVYALLKKKRFSDFR